MKIKITQYKAFVLLLLLGCGLTGCKKFIEVDAPPTSVNEGNIYESDGTAISAVLGIYTTISISDISGMLSYYPELSADNLQLLNTNRLQDVGFYQNNLLASYAGTEFKPWSLIYPQIFTCNAAIEGLTKSKTLTPAVRQNLLGQAYFLRALFYFYLTNFYGDVPLSTSTDYTVNNILRRSSATQVYSQIIADLKQAHTMLPEGYLTGDMITTFSTGLEQRVTANRSAVSALLARVYLYEKDYANAELMSAEVIAKSDLYSASIPLSQVFLKNSMETILALQPAFVGYNAREAEVFTLRPGEPAVTTNRSAFISPSFIDNIQTGDQRKTVWINTITTSNVTYSYPAKYKALTNAGFSEQSIVLRLAEQYLIRAEARIHQNKTVQGIEDLNVLRERAVDKSQTNENLRLKLLATSLSKEEALAALNYERRIELFAEYGHRWFDLKRTGQVDAVMTTGTANKGGSWASFKALYPVPVEELTSNPNLQQNPGYTN